MCDKHVRLETAGKVGRGGRGRSQIKDIIGDVSVALELPETPISSIVNLLAALKPQDKIYRTAAKDSALAKEFETWKVAIIAHLAKILKVNPTLELVKSALVEHGFDLGSTLSFLQ